MRQAVRRKRQKVRAKSNKKKDNLPIKSNSSTQTVQLGLLYNIMPENDCAMFIVSSSTNKIDPNYKCAKCGKIFRSIKLVSVHSSNCKSNKFLNNKVSANDVRWVCTMCHESFFKLPKLTDHLNVCNIRTKNYEKACEKPCPVCNFKCISPILYEKHDCSTEIKKLNRCHVKVNNLKLNCTTAFMIECEFCSELVEEKDIDQHFRVHHPGKSNNGNIRPIYVDLSIHPSKTVLANTQTWVVKSEPQDNVANYMPNRAFDNRLMPPPPVSMSSCQTSREATSNHTNALDEEIHKMCKCPNRKDAGDVKPCLECLSNFALQQYAQNLNIKVKQEAPEASKVNNSCNVTASSAENGKNMGGIEDRIFRQSLQICDDLQSYTVNIPDYQSTANHITHQTIENYTSDFQSTLTPPLTPSALRQSATALASGEPCSPSDVSIDDLSLVAHLDEPRCPDELVHYINDDCSTDIPLMSQYDDQEFFAEEPCKLTHIWDVDVDLEVVDVWAIVPSEDNETVEKYICSKCFTCLDQKSIIKHYMENHDKKAELFAMYVVKKEESEKLDDDPIKQWS